MQRRPRIVPYERIAQHAYGPANPDATVNRLPAPSTFATMREAIPWLLLSCRDPEDEAAADVAASPIPARNRLLAALRTRDAAAETQLLAGLETVELKLHARVMSPDRPIRHIYFPETGVLSEIQTMRNGSAVEVNLVGSDGMAGLAVYLGGVSFPMEVICQAPGAFLRMGADNFREEVSRNPLLLAVLHGYTQALLAVRAQAIGCDRFHDVEARAARWLLEMDDRVPHDEFTMTHQFLALMLGVRRQTVSAVAQNPGSAGLDRLPAGLHPHHRPGGSGKCHL